MTLHSDLPAERAGVAGVLSDFHLLDLFSQRGTIPVGEALRQKGSLRGWLLRRVPRKVTAVYLVPYFPVTPTSSK